jgi:hypothetical protein
MVNDDNAESPAKVNTVSLSLKPRAIEKVFTECVMDIMQILVLDGIDILPNGFRVRRHDLHGQLPEIIVKNSGDTFQDKNKLGRETCKMLAIADLRDQIVTWLPGSRFLPPTSIDGKAVVGLQARPETWIIEGNDYLTAYHELHSQTVG